jgi:hypothetical protein
MRRNPQAGCIARISLTIPLNKWRITIVLPKALGFWEDFSFSDLEFNLQLRSQESLGNARPVINTINNKIELTLSDLFFILFDCFLFKILYKQLDSLVIFNPE